MKIHSPKLEKLIRAQSFQKEIKLAKQEEVEIVNKLFIECQEERLDEIEIELSKCEFQSCHFCHSSFAHCDLSDTVFKECDFSNCDFSQSNFVRVTFENCKLVGCNFSEASFYQIEIKKSNLSYANFSLGVLKQVSIYNSKAQSSSFQEVKWEKIKLEETDFTLAQFFRTTLNHIDFSSCNIEGIVVRLEDLKGVTTTQYQAIQFAKLLGIIIKEELIG